jgi:protein involved in polysaccharide export with SLBB domain
MHRRLFIVLVAVAIAGGAGCASLPKSDGASVHAPPRFDEPQLALAQPERLHPGERLEVICVGTPPGVPCRASFERWIQEDGTITLASNKIFTAAGKTLSEFTREVQNYYVPQFFKSVRIRNHEPSVWIYVFGEVGYPSRFIFEDQTLRMAILGAAGFTASANKQKVRLITSEGDRFVIDCRRVPRSREEDVRLLPGDYIYVPRSSKWLFW